MVATMDGSPLTPTDFASCAGEFWSRTCVGPSGSCGRGSNMIERNQNDVAAVNDRVCLAQSDEIIISHLLTNIGLTKSHGRAVRPGRGLALHM